MKKVVTRANLVLGIFAKQPLAGQVKTRLAAETSASLAAEAAEAFLRDTLEKCRALPVARFVVYAPASGREYFTALAGEAFSLEEQREGDLGERMAGFLSAHVSDERHVVLIGADSPTLPVEFIERAFAELENADVVLGPATDGGYYLLGCKGRVPPIFDRIAWGGPEVLQASVRRIAGAGLRLFLLPPWYDVDTLADVRMLKGHLAALRAAGMEANCSHSEALLERLSRPGTVLG